MDAKNWFETKATYTLTRLEYGFGLIVALAFFFWHITDVRWLPAVVLFVYIDLIGYIPGAIAHHRAHGRPISRGYYVAYNIMHSLITQSVVIGAWILIDKPEWALLVIPIHLFGDRSIFGNFLKPFAVSFEPLRHPAFARLLGDLKHDLEREPLAPTGAGLR